MANYTRKDITGQRFGRLVAIRPTLQAVGQPSMWLFKCDCGQEVEADHSRVTHSGRGAKRSCGCLYRENLDFQHARNVKHGKVNTPIYRTYRNMMNRCHNAKAKDYYLYGGRGIYVCERWRESFSNFYADMGDKPDGLSLDRIDNNGPYSPENCRWATPLEQVRNRRCTHVIEFLGETKSLSAWAVDFCMHKEALRRRIKAGWSVESALTTPVRTR